MQDTVVVEVVVEKCRMYEAQPTRVEDHCYLCAYRGGYEGCKRSASPILIASAARRINAS